MFVSPSNQPRGEYHLPKFFKFLSWILSVLPKRDGDVFRKVIRNKDSVSPSPKLTVNVPENRPAFPQKERQTSFFGTIFSRANSLFLFGSVCIYIYIYVSSISISLFTLGENFENPMDDPLVVSVSILAPMGFRCCYRGLWWFSSCDQPGSSAATWPGERRVKRGKRKRFPDEHVVVVLVVVVVVFFGYLLTCHLSLVTGHWSLITYYLLLITYYLLLVACYCLLLSCYLPHVLLVLVLNLLVVLLAHFLLLNSNQDSSDHQANRSSTFTCHWLPGEAFLITHHQILDVGFNDFGTFWPYMKRRRSFTFSDGWLNHQLLGGLSEVGSG